MEWVVFQGSNRQVGLSYKEEGTSWEAARAEKCLKQIGGGKDERRVDFEADYDGKDCQVRDKTPVIEVLAAGIHATARLSDPDKPSHSLMEGMKDVKMKMAGSVVPVARVGKVGLSTHIAEYYAALGQQNMYLILLTWGMMRCQGRVGLPNQFLL